MISDNIAFYLLKNGYIQESELPIYKYGLSGFCNSVFQLGVVIMLCIVCCCFILVAEAAAVVKKGNYCQIGAGYSSDSSSTYFYYAEGTNLTSSTRMMTVSLQAYYPNGSLYDESRVTLNTDANQTRQRTLSGVPTTCSTYAQTTIYAGTSISTSQLETVRVKVN